MGKKVGSLEFSSYIECLLIKVGGLRGGREAGLLFKVVAVELGGNGEKFVVGGGHFFHLFVVFFEADVQVPEAVGTEFATGSDQGSLE